MGRAMGRGGQRWRGWGLDARWAEVGKGGDGKRNGWRVKGKADLSLPLPVWVPFWIGGGKGWELVCHVLYHNMVFLFSVVRAEGVGKDKWIEEQWR
ncbi:hypothetical protein K523DRAFT_25704 [Schizophyllum commune Tattone D]|nr:hypothetical protein K523DRAFT_25704 [Schizophyllum commune Tattone D]